MEQLLSNTEPNILVRQDGAYLPVVAGIIVALITIMGWALDSANLFAANLSVQKAVDAGAVSGAAKLALEGGSFDSPTSLIDTNVKQAVETLTRENLILAGVTAANINSVEATVTRTRAPRRRLTVQVSADVRVPFYVMRAVPGAAQVGQIRATSTSEVFPAIISLLLDRSGSMGCPNNNPGCGCAPSCPSSPPRKLDRLINAVNNFFLPSFDQDRDMIGVTLFSDNGQVLVTPDPAGGFELTSIRNAIAGITPAGITNLCDGIEAAYYNTRNVLNANPEREVAYVTFSDGASTAARLRYASPWPGLPQNPLGSGRWDYYSWAMEWKQGGSSAPIDGVSRLVPSPYPISTIACNSGGCNNSPACSVLSYNYGYLDDGASELGGCLRDLKFYDLGGAIWPRFPNNAPVSSFRERYIDCGIAYRDWIAAQRGIWFGVGLGRDPSISIDPYQNSRDTLSRKDNFMKRLTFDYEPEVPFSGFRDYTDLSLDEQQIHGEYFRTPNDTDLPNIFRAVAQRIKLRLIS